MFFALRKSCLMKNFYFSLQIEKKFLTVLFSNVWGFRIGHFFTVIRIVYFFKEILNLDFNVTCIFFICIVFHTRFFSNFNTNVKMFELYSKVDLLKNSLTVSHIYISKTWRTFQSSLKTAKLYFQNQLPRSREMSFPSE